ncbi:MAG TPA: hypothetical protein VF389_03385 [Woeseiaceae bacterium]
MVEKNNIHRFVRLVVAFAIGIAVALYAYDRVTDPEPALQRAQEEAAVLASRSILADYLAVGPGLQIVDPLAPDRVVGKVFVYPSAEGFDVSGHYRRSDTARWHPFLMRLDHNAGLLDLSVADDDEQLRQRSAADPRLRVVDDRPEK